MVTISEAFLPLVLSVAVSLVLGYPAIRLARYFNLMDIPGSAPHKKHPYPVALGGGILLMATLFFMATLHSEQLEPRLLAIISAATIIFIFGLWDDAKGLSVFPKIIGQLIAVAVLIAFRVQVNFIGTLPFADGFPLWLIQSLNIAITLFWTIGITNALNMIDSMDGIVAGLGIIASVCFVAATKLSNQTDLMFWALILLGINIGLYYWNRMPAKLFLGDSGSQTIGFLLASFGIMYNPLNLHPESSWIVPIMLLSIPIFDTTLVVYSRLKKKQPVSNGRQDHTYHRLIAMGFSPRSAVLVTHTASIIISGMAFLLLYIPPLLANLAFGVIVLCGLGILIWFEQMSTLDDRREGVNDV